MLEGAGDDVAEDEELGVAVCSFCFCVSSLSIHVYDGVWRVIRMLTESSSSLDSVFIDDAERTPTLVSRVVVRGKGKCVVCVEPAVVGVAALRPGSLCDFQRSRCCG